MAGKLKEGKYDQRMRIGEQRAELLSYTIVRERDVAKESNTDYVMTPLLNSFSSVFFSGTLSLSS
jgi:hypothetical protein